MMLVESKKFPPIPREIVRTAKAIFGHKNFYMQVGEALEAVLAGHFLSESSEGTLDPTFVLITLFQAVEGLTDIQAIDAVRTRIDWKYALHLPVHPPAMQEDALCQFRCRVLNSPALLKDFQNLVEQLLTLEPTKSGRFQELKKEEVLPTVCSINFIASVREAIRQTLEALAVRHPDWLKKIALPQWYGRYTGSASLPLVGDEETLLEVNIADMAYLLQQIHRSVKPELEELGEVKVLDQLWSQHFHLQSRERSGGYDAVHAQNCNSCPKRAAI